jgi:hypothetical protein
VATRNARNPPAADRVPVAMQRTTIFRRPWSAPSLVLLLAATPACARPPVPVVEPVPEPVPRFEHAVAWTASAEVVLRSDSSSFLIPRPFTRLDVIGGDTALVEVRCGSCPGELTGTVPVADLVFEVVQPELAASGSLAEFALAVREAAARGEVAALRPVMSPEFTFSFVGLQARDDAIAAWRTEDFRGLALIPALLDQGLATRDSALWVAPPAHAQTLDYRGPRLGFRRDGEGRWEWIFLIHSIRE